MNRNRLVIGLFLAIVLALLLATFVYREFNKLASRPVVGASQQIVVAAQTLPLGTRLDASNLRTMPWPANQPVAAGMCARVKITGTDHRLRRHCAPASQAGSPARPELE